MIVFSYRTYLRGPCLCVTEPTDTPTYGNGVSETTISKITGIFHTSTLRYLESYLGDENLETEMGMYWKYIFPAIQ